MARVKEQGNVLGYVLVGALLAALLLGGIFVARHITSQGGASTEVASDKSDESTDNSSSASDTRASQSTDDKKTSSDQDLKQALESKSTASQQSSQQQTDSSSAASDATKLPATGPEDALLPLAGATLIAGTSIAYARSRRLI